MKQVISNQRRAVHNIISLRKLYSSFKEFSAFVSILSFLLFSGSIYAHNTHDIKMVAERLPGGYLAYKMMQYEITDHLAVTTDITSRYSTDATMPGPTIVATEEDVINIELFYAIAAPADPTEEHVSLHVHGVHYDILSDGTLKYINMVKDESAIPVMSYMYRWDAAVGTAGTWAYHDHNFNTHNGAEDRGLYGALIVNPLSGVVEAQNGGKKQSIALDEVAKDYVLYVLDDAFMGMEIDNTNNHMQTPLFDNPALTAQKNTFVRFHLISLGTNLHKFELPSYGWIDPGTRQTISMKPIGSLEKHFFTIRATHNSTYMDTTFSSKLLGMEGIFQVN
jgi:hypothetical protein